MKILVTGGTGFIGAAIVKRLQDVGHHVDIFDRTLGYDIRDRGSVNQSVRYHDAVIHLAGILGTDELFDNVHDAIDINISGSVNVLDACVDHGAHYVGITMPPVFPSIYTATKVSAGRFATAYHHTHGVSVTHVRAFNVFGPAQHHGEGHPRKIIPAFSVEGWNNIPMKIWGDGQQMVDLIYVDDVARVFESALYAPGDDDIIDAGTKTGWTVTQVADYVKDITGSSSPHNYQPMRRGEIPTKIVSKGEGWEHLTYTPEFREIDLVKTIVSYRDHG